MLDAHPLARNATERHEGGFDRFKQAVEVEKITLLEDPDGENAEPRLVNCRWLDLDEEVFLDGPLVHEVHCEFATKASKSIGTCWPK